MIVLRSVLVSERICPAAEPEAFHKDLIGPASLSFTLLAAMFCKKQKTFFLMEMQRDTGMHVHTV